jgi:hypothetical protein
MIEVHAHAHDPTLRLYVGSKSTTWIGEYDGSLWEFALGVSRGTMVGRVVCAMTDRYKRYAPSPITTALVRDGPEATYRQICQPVALERTCYSTPISHRRAIVETATHSTRWHGQHERDASWAPLSKPLPISQLSPRKLQTRA